MTDELKTVRRPAWSVIVRLGGIVAIVGILIAVLFGYMAQSLAGINVGFIVAVSGLAISAAGLAFWFAARPQRR